MASNIQKAKTDKTVERNELIHSHSNFIIPLLTIQGEISWGQRRFMYLFLYILKYKYIIN